MAAWPFSSCSPSNDVVEILRKLHSIGFCRDLSTFESDISLQKLSTFFNRILSLFQQEIQQKKEIRPVPAMLGDGQAVDLFKLYFVVRERGGYESVTDRKGWGSVSEAIGFDSGVGASVKLVYFKYLGALDRWLEKVLAKKEDPKKLKVEETKKEEEGKKTPVSKKNHFLTPVRDGGRRLRLDNDEKGDGNGDVVVIEPEVEKKAVVARKGPGLGSFNKRKRSELVGMLDWVLRVAKNPADFTIGKILPSDGGKEKGNHVVGELYSLALSARKAMFLKKIRRTDGDMSNSQKGQGMLPSIYEDHINAGILASEKLRYSQRLHALNKQSNSGNYSETSTIPDSGGMDRGSVGEETSKRKLKNSSLLSELNDIMDRLPKDKTYQLKRVNVKTICPAEVPPWTDEYSSTSYNSDDLKWLGTPVCTPEDQEHYPLEQDPIGKGRQGSCRCERPGSIECVRFHVAEKRFQSKRELGSAFHSWRFDCMGEEVALSWTEEEAQKFKTVVRLNPPTQMDKLWDKLHQAFPLKGTKNLVSYYFNVFILARRSYQNRMTPDSIDSDDEDAEFGFLSIPFGQDAIKAHAPKSNFCAQNSQCLDIDD